MSSQVFVLNLQFLQSGGFGNVFVGHRSDKGGPLAVKYLRENRDPHARKLFSQQVQILARKIPGMVRLFGWDTNAEYPYYVMEYFPRGTLSQYAGRLSDDQLLGVATELAQHLSNVHAVVGSHGDVKPPNIFITQDGHLRLGDPSGNGLHLSMLVPQNQGGTPSYAAPEIAAGGPVSRPGDVYAYCATLYEMLTGRVPQKGQRLDPTAEGYTRAPKLREIIVAGCQHDPNARPTVKEVMRMLNGTTWADIQASRTQVRDLVLGGVLIGGVCLAIAAFAE